MATIRRRELVLRGLQTGKTLERKRNWQGRFVVLLGGSTVVDDDLVRSMLADGSIASSLTSSDGEVTTYLPGDQKAATVAATRAAARGTDRATSTGAAAAVGDIRASHREVLNLFAIYGQMTQAQLVRYAHEEAKRLDRPAYSDSRYRSACAELERLQYLAVVGTVPTGHTSRAGVPTHAELWRLTDAGEAVVGRGRTHRTGRVAAAPEGPGGAGVHDGPVEGPAEGAAPVHAPDARGE